MSGSLKRQALGALVWSLVQSWGGRASTFLLFLVLARLLSPADLGLMTVVALVVNIVALVAEQGFGDAIVQRKALKPDDANLPFVVALCTLAVLSVIVWFSADRISGWLNAPGLPPYLRVTIVFTPVTTVYAFQEAFYRRDLDYRPLALRMLAGSLVAGAAGIVLAVSGAGIWSLVAQTVILSVVSAIWVWRRPHWKPRARFDRASFAQMYRYSISVLGTRLLDFVGTRTIEFLIATQMGMVALGLYTVGSRIYQTFIQLLFGATQSVLLGAFSKVSHDIAKLRHGLLTSLTAAAALCSPAFVGVAALAPEIAVVLFGSQWKSSADVMRPLMLLGAVQCVQFLNGSVFAAIGRTDYVLKLNLVKTAFVVATLVLVRTTDPGRLTIVMAAAQMVTMPVVFHLGVRAVDTTVSELLRRIGPFAVACSLAFGATAVIRTVHLAEGSPAWASLVILGIVFVSVYSAAALLLGRGALRELMPLLPARARGRLEWL